MKLSKKILSFILLGAMVASLSSCSNSSSSSSEESSGTTSSYTQDEEKLTFNSAKWNYDKTNDVYWQIKVGYCANPMTTDYETMGIYVPGAYMTGTANSDGTYTCELNTNSKVNGYTASTAPIVFPINTPGYAGQASPTSYSYDGISSYIKAGQIYVYAGMRGRSSIMGTSSSNEAYSGGAPWGVTDLKAAVRYYRFNKSALPGNTDNIFTFGMSGGGAQSALVGATGDSKLYYSYLESIGSAMYDKDGNTISDAVSGSMCWCPITSLDSADEAYEWNMGQYFSTDTRASTTFTSALSKDLAQSYAPYINKLGLKDQNGTNLALTESSTGIYTSGTYYDYLLSVTEGSLNNFLSDTKFPYTESTSFMASGNFAGGDTDSEKPAMGGTDSEKPAMGGTDSEKPAMDGTGGANSSEATTPKTYETVQDYINSLNSDEKWIVYDSKTNTAKITSIEAFVKNCKPTTKAVGAFDAVDRSQGENNLFGNGQADSLHFDSVIASLLKTNSTAYAKFSDWKPSYITDYENDLKSVDSLGTSMQTRVDMYNPMYFLSDYYAGYKTSTVATHWRIRTGIDQGDTALTVETNLALALQSNSSIKDVDFETVWGLKHTMAERTGDSTDNFIKWVNECVSE
ncbi:subtype A tannase [Clostridium lacusfryxellense]|uniref:subtype A tannase n=1 Tax=Clostridium lacusfryxellense TaxID=205328 RepID=UPI001C0C2AA6|nr:subtype A tannase [Clostridium lacusfryxellense]MBU3112616.1 esterase [Clostridium lacusfryxellense]